MNLIEAALANGQTALSEFQSKQLLSSMGIPVTREELVQTADDAISAAERIGYPVVLKACAWELMHKSEHGCIELNLTTPEAVCKAYNKICEKINSPLNGIRPLEGVLVQEMVEGQRELVIGLSRNPQFGACVMLGFGGIMTEVIRDTVFRVAPFDKVEALDMIHSLKTKPMLAAFRGQKPADLTALCQILMALGHLGLSEESISEIDINPLIISPDGTIKAVDALIILENKGSL
jgi:succinyl-CoA synthetase beta subunit